MPLLQQANPGSHLHGLAVDEIYMRDMAKADPARVGNALSAVHSIAHCREWYRRERNCLGRAEVLQAIERRGRELRAAGGKG